MQAANNNIFNKPKLPVGVSILFIALGFAFFVTHYLFSDLTNQLAFNTYNIKQAYFANELIESGYLWTLLSYQFLHSGIFHFLANCLMFFQVGPDCEIELYVSSKSKSKKRVALVFIIYFIICGAFGALGHIILNTDAILVGASGSISGIFGGYLISSYRKLEKVSLDTPDLNIIDARKHILNLSLQSAGVFLFINVFLAAVSRHYNLIPISWEGHLFGFIGGLVFYPILLKIIKNL